MKRFVLAVLAAVATAAAAPAWNNKGHMVVARLAWNELTPDERAKVTAVLKAHPHYDEFLKAERPSGFGEDEWAFLRAATWADWVRSGPAMKKYHHGEWHYINYDYVLPEGSVKAAGPAASNIVKALTDCKKAAEAGGDQAERAVNVTWLFHLCGDIQQPMHSVAMCGPDFKDGDRGGNRVLFRIGTRQAQLHSFWDGLLGADTNRADIGKAVFKVERMVKEHPEMIADDLKEHTTPEEWSKEAFAAAKTSAYLEGRLPMANADSKPDVSKIAAAPDGYEEKAGEVARYAVAKAGKRLAKVLKDVIAAN